jgi:hypothetical protein
MRWATALWILALAGSGCGPAEPVEERLRRVVDKAVSAVEAGDVGALMELVSDSYADARGNDKPSLRRAVAWHILRHRTAHVLPHVQAIELASERSARLELIAALAGTTVPDLEALARIDADVYRFELELRLEEDDDWRVTRAEWEPASLEDLL